MGVVVLFFARLLFRVEVIGRENIPERGPLLVLPTHTSYLDPPLVGWAIGLHTSFLSREGIFKVPPLGFILRRMNTYAIQQGAADRDAIRTCRRLLRAGWPLIFFPEGTRSPTGRLGRIQPGFAMILDGLDQTPYLPVVMQDTWRAMPRGSMLPRPVKVRIHIGVPETLPPRREEESRRAYHERCCDQLRRRYIELGAET
jgi:1-acyl-sn-glycerol-3-phosphate acyltransferase